MQKQKYFIREVVNLFSFLKPETKDEIAFRWQIFWFDTIPDYLSKISVLKKIITTLWRYKHKEYFI